MFIMEDFSDSELLLGGGQRYYQGGSGRYNSLWKNIIDIIWRVPYYIVLIMYVRIVASKQFVTFPDNIKLFGNAAVISIVISFFFLVVPAVSNFTLYYRFINFAMIPSAVFVVYCFMNNITPKLVNAFFYLSLVAVLLHLLYKTIPFV